jgi:predicted ATPase
MIARALAIETRPGRVVTLTGPGGVGKTRLAIEVANDLSSDFRDGVWWCDLAPIDKPAGLVPAIAATLPVTFRPEMSPLDAVVDALRGRRALVVFDNCEHLLDAAAEVIDAVARGCPTVASLATSREPLALAGEHVWPVRPLDPDVDGVELFVERALAADATFRVADDRAEIVELCGHLDGLPLAIELAAARVRAMTTSELSARLRERVDILGTGVRGVPGRQRTLVATLDWSYGLLTSTAQTSWIDSPSSRAASATP